MAAICSSQYWQQCSSVAHLTIPVGVEEEADKAIAALQILPESEYRLALEGLAHIAVQRNF